MKTIAKYGTLVSLIAVSCFLLYYNVNEEGFRTLKKFNRKAVDITPQDNDDVKYDPSHDHDQQADHGDPEKGYRNPSCRTPHGYNTADIQVSEMVEKLDFHSEHGGHKESSFPEVKPLSGSIPLQVFLIPHSHCDPGWLKTYDKYYEENVSTLLTWLYIFASEHPDFKYIYAEISFFKRWWEEQEQDVRNDMKRMIKNGQIEIVQGGWVQNDEANTHFFAMIHQMLDGHHWLKDNLPEAIPVSGWAIDPFGLSPTMAYINKLFGLNAMHVNRVHYSVKNHLARQKKLNFNWRQSWDSTGRTDIHAHIGPFASYSSLHSCGPDLWVCCSFDFRKERRSPYSCQGSENKVERTTPENVHRRSLRIIEQWRKKAALHSVPVIFVELGDDFAYGLKEDIEDTYRNFKGIIEYINNTPELNVTVSWGTVSDYFAAVQESKVSFPSLTGDFFTYADREYDYWSGYYTSRPFYKNLDRKLESHLRLTEIFTALNPRPTDESKLTGARETLSLFQHHDGITGTSKPFVVDDYGKMLHTAFNNCTQLLIKIVNGVTDDPAPTFPTQSRDKYNALDTFKSVPLNHNLFLFNALPRAVHLLQEVAVTLPDVQVVDDNKETPRQQLEPNLDPSSSGYHIVFLPFVKPVSISRFTLLRENLTKKVLVDSFDYQLSPENMKYFDVKSQTRWSGITIGSRFKATFDAKSGRLTSITMDGITVKVKMSLINFLGKSGVYLFLPDGLGTDIISRSSTPSILVTRGTVRDKVRVMYSSVVMTYTIIHSPGIEGSYMDIDIITDMKEDGDLSLRIETDIRNEGSLFTDLNGLSIQQHHYKSKLKIQGNIFPMSSLAFIQDNSKRLTIFGDGPHGVGSLKEGWIDIVLDRRSKIDDDRGLGQGFDDNLPTPSKLRVTLEQFKTQIQNPKQHYMTEYLSLAGHFAQQTLLNPGVLLAKPMHQSRFSNKQFMAEYGCDEELVNLRHIKNSECLLIRRKLGISCNFDNKNLCLSAGTAQQMFPHLRYTLQPHPLSPFHNQSETLKWEAMEIRSDYVTFHN